MSRHLDGVTMMQLQVERMLFLYGAHGVPSFWCNLVVSLLHYGLELSRCRNGTQPAKTAIYSSWCYNMVLSKDTGFSQLQLVLLPQAAASVTQNQLCTCSLCDDEPPDAYTRNITISPETCRP